jgi:cold shock protein
VDPAKNSVTPAPDSHQASTHSTGIETHRRDVYFSPIDLWPDDWAASLRTAGRTFRLPLQMIDFRACARCRRSALLHLQARGHTMATGTVKWFNEQKGYGFIQPDQGGKDVFVHISAVERSGLSGLAEGMKVSYEVQADRRSGKESATNLKIA